MSNREVRKIKHEIVSNNKLFSFTTTEVFFNKIKKTPSKQEYKENYGKNDHYSKIISDKQYFLASFKSLIFKEIQKRKYDIKNKDEFEDLISESYKILIELFDKIQETFKTKYKDKPIIEKTKILQAFIGASYSGRLFNWWCKWRNLKYIINPEGGRGAYKKMVFNGFNHQIYSDEAQDDINIKINNSIDIEGKENSIEYNFTDSLFDIEEFSIDNINLDIFWEHVELVLQDIHYIIFKMYYKEGMTYDNIIKTLGISKQKVTTIKFYADQKVKKYFKQHNIFGDKNAKQ